MKTSYYKYVGKGDFLPGVPTRDLTPDEADAYGLNAIKESGLYQFIDEDRALTSKPEKKG